MLNGICKATSEEKRRLNKRNDEENDGQTGSWGYCRGKVCHNDHPNFVNQSQRRCQYLVALL